ncbi:MAG: hypothetical protein ITG04_01325 [Proteiniphilum sp.]|nr:hypothetical protein [Proteiniphilum sp.]
MKKKRPDDQMMHKNSFLKRCCYSFIALFIWMGAAHAQLDEDIHTKTVTLGFNQEKLFNALLALEEKSGFKLVFPGEPVNAAYPVNLQKEERTGGCHTAIDTERY